MPAIEFNHCVSFSTYSGHDKRALPAATLSTKRKTKIKVMATRPHFIHNMFPASLNYFPLPAPMAPSASTNAKSKEDSSAPITALIWF